MITNSRYCTKRRRRLYHFTSDEGFFIGKDFYKVPAGYEFDGLSVPVPFQWMFPRNGRGKWAGSLHDYLYDTKGRGLHGDLHVSRKHADQLFRNHLIKDGVAKWQANLFWFAVRVGGWWHWNKNTFPEYLRK
jgi:hypothetical protein